MTVATVDNRPAVRRAAQHAARQERVTRPWYLRWELAVLVVYGAVLGLGVSRHEPWVDEVQSWLLARDTTPWYLLFHQLRFEGTPGLWQLLLMPFAKLGLPVSALSAVGAACAFGGAAMVLFASPLPAVVRAAFPFTYFALFQYGVVARSYCLLGLLLCAVAWAYPARYRRPYLYFGLMVLESGIAVQSMVVAAALALLFLIGTPFEWRRDPAAKRRSHVIAMAGFGVFELAMAWTLRTPAQESSPLAHVPVPPLSTALHTMATTVEVTYTGHPALSLAVVAVCAAWFLWRRCFWAFALPTVAVLVFGAVKVQQLWHEGYLVWLLVFGLWLSFDASLRRPRREGLAGSWVDRAGTWVVGAVVLGMCAVQIVWSANSLGWDYDHAYAPGAAAAQYLRRHHLTGGPIATDGAYWTTDIQAYFSHNIFANVDGGRGPAYFAWSLAVPLDTKLVSEGRARVLVSTVWGWGNDPKATPPPVPGYHVVAEFPGQMYWETAVSEHEDMAIYVRNG